MRRLVAILLVILLTAGIPLYACSAGKTGTKQYTYTVNSDDTITIESYNGKDKKLVIPSEIDGHTVTRIGRGAIWGKPVTEIILPETLVELDTIGIIHCSSLKKLTLNEGLQSVADYAIVDCPKLKEINIPYSLMEFGSENEGPFSQCPALDTFVVPDDHPVFKVVDGVLFDDAKKSLIWYPATKKDQEYRIPEGVLSILTYAFTESKASRVIFSDSITIVWNDAFCRCDKLTELVISAGAKSLRYPLKEVYHLENIIVDEANPVYRSVDGVLFKENTLMYYPAAKTGETYVVPDGTTIIDVDAFAGTKLKEVILPDTVQILSDGAFRSAAVQRLVLPEGVTGLYGKVFENSELTSITIPASLEYISDNPFVGCVKLEEVIVDEHNPVFTVTDDALINRQTRHLIWYLLPSSRETYTIPEKVRSIGEYAFADSKLKEVIVPEGVESIGAYAFTNCKKLLKIVLPSSLTAIENNAFKMKKKDGSGYEAVSPEIKKRRIYVVPDSYALNYLMEDGFYDMLWYSE